MDVTRIFVIVLICLQSLCLAKQQFFRELPSNVTVAQGENVLLRCVVGNEARIGNTKWTKDAAFMNDYAGYPRYRMIGDHAQGEYHLSISNATLEDDGPPFECQVDPAPGEERGLMAIAYVTVLVPPSEVSLDGTRKGDTIEVKADTALDVSCRAIGAKPAAKLLWYRNGRRVPEQFYENREIREDEKRFTTISRLRLIAPAQDDGAVFTCDPFHPAASPSSAPRAQFTLSVIYPPGQPVITGYNAGRTVAAGDLIQLRCMAENGNPLPELIWYRNSVSAGRNFTATTTRGYTMNEYSFIAQPADNDAEYRCEASNAAAISPLSSSIRLKVYFAPERVQIAGPDQAKVGDTIQLSCSCSPSHPEAKLLWLVDGEPFYDHAQTNWIASPTDGSGTGTLSSSSVTIKISHRRPEIMVTCAARNEQLPLPNSDTVTRKKIQVFYPPDSAKITVQGKKPAVAGEQISLTCLAVGGHPAPTIEWFKDEQRITSVTTSRYDSTMNATISEYAVVLAPRDNLVKIECRAFNWASDGRRVSDSATLTVHFPPETVTITPNPPEFVAGTPSDLICESGSGNPSPTVEWFRGDKQLDSVISHNKTGDNGGWTIKKKLLLSPTLQDNGAVFECRVWSPVGPASISERVTLTVNYKPIFLVPISQQVEVLEGESIVVNASAYSNPPVEQYNWHKEQSTVPSSGRVSVSGPVIEIASVHRDDAGVYTCQAKNRIGISTMTATILVKYPPEIKKITPTVLTNEGDNVTLVCEVSAFPSPPGVAKWERFAGDKLNGSRFVHTVTKESSVLMISGVGREDTGNYTCLANNGIGQEDIKATLVLVRQAPILDYSPLYTKAAAPIGKITELTCVADGVPEVQFTWYHEIGGVDLSSLVHENDRISLISKRVSFMRYKSHMIIRNVQEKDYGIYRCVAKNEIGSSSVAVKFGRPESPDRPTDAKVLNKTHDSVTLGWDPGFSGGLPVQFRIRYHIIGAGTRKNPERHMTVLTRTTSATIDGLQPKTTYSFAVQAINEVGESAFSNITAVTLGPSRLAQDMSKDELPVLVIVLVALAGIILLIVNAALVVCFLRRHNRKKMEERAATARLGLTGRKVQMYSSDGAAIIGDGYQSDKYGMGTPEQRPRSAMSDGNSSVRTVIEVEGAGVKSGYAIVGGSPPLQNGYLLDGNQDYDDVPTEATYTEAIRSTTSTLQRYLANGVYNVPRAALGAPNTEDQCESTYVAGQLVDDVLPSPAIITGQDYGQYSYRQPQMASQQNERRFSPPIAAQGQGRMPYAEVRPLLSSYGPNDAIPVRGSPVRNIRTGSPILTTFASMPMGTNMPDELNEADSFSGDLV